MVASVHNTPTHRTMAMVCMGSCVFTIDSTFAFWDGPMGWDASRVSAAIPSGVGFLGAASIWKGTVSKDGNSAPEVHGLTTATSVWLSAAVGILVGGGLLVPAGFSTLSSVVYLRFAPRYALAPPTRGRALGALCTAARTMRACALLLAGCLRERNATDGLVGGPGRPLSSRLLTGPAHVTLPFAGVRARARVLRACVKCVS